MSDIDQIEKEVNQRYDPYKKDDFLEKMVDMTYEDIISSLSPKKHVSLVEKLANKGYKFKDVENTPKSHFTKKRKRNKKK